MLLLIPFIALSAAAPAREARPADRARETLRRALAESGGGTARLHAGEALALDGEGGLVRPVFAAALRESGDDPAARVGLWRVLARSSRTEAEKAQWIARVESVLDPAAPDWINATESLAKLGCVLHGAPLEKVGELVRTHPEPEVLFGLWDQVLAGDRGQTARIARDLARPEAVARLRAAYILGWLKVRDAGFLVQLARAADREPRESAAFPYVIGAAFILRADSSRTGAWRRELEEVLKDGAPLAQAEACRCLALGDGRSALGRLVPLLDSAEIETRIGAAAAILTVARK